MAVLVVVAVLAATAGGSHARPERTRSIYLLQKCTYPLYRPTEFVTSCGSGNVAYEAMRWSRWSRRSAQGQGRIRQRLVDESYRVIVAPVRVRLSRPMYCAGVSRWVFTRMSYDIDTSDPDVPAAGSERLTVMCRT